MKKLLTTITLSAFVATSTSNLKPLFASNVINHVFKSNQVNNKNISIENQNSSNPFIPKQLPSLNEQGIGAFAVDSSGNIYAGTSDGLYKSTDGINFEQVNDKLNASVNDIAIQNTTIYVSTNNDGLWKSNDKGTFDKINEQNYIRCLAIDSSGNIYAGTTSYGLLKSTNGGNSFSRIDNNIKMDFINKIIFDNHNNIWVACDNGLYKSTDGINFEQVKGVPNTFSISSIAVTIDGKIYAGTKWKGLYKSTDGINFDKIDTINNSIITGILITTTKIIYISTNGDGLWKSNDKGTFDKINESPNNITFNSLVVTSNNVVYIGTYKGNGGIWTINLIEQLVKINKPDTFDKSWPLYNGIVYNSAQKIDIKEKLVAKATLDNKSITIPTTDLDISVGEHNLILTLKDKVLASVFGGDSNTGQVVYKLWLKTSIDKKDIQYSTNVDDTDLTDLSLGFISNSGNTNNCPIIETKSKDGTGTHDASINVNFNDILIDYPNSYYVKGTVDDTTNDFTETETHQTFSKNLSIKTDGIYHLHLVDKVGNNYDSYLELGKNNWNLKGTFNDDTLNRFKIKLNVTVNLTDSKQLAQATGWLTNYDKFASNLFVKSLQENGKGFDQDIKKELENDFKWFLKPLTYEPNNEPNFNNGIDKDKLNNKIIKIAEQKLQDGLAKLPQNLNVDPKNVVNKSTLDSYSTWINNYQKFINNNKDSWISDVVKVASRGFATKDQENQISSHIRSLNFKNYLQHVIWNQNVGLTTSSDYKQFVELHKLQSDIIDWVNQEIPEINTAYENAIKNAENGLNLHGYTISEILNGKSKPQTKSEIANFADGKSYRDWLQSQANMKYKGWQLAMGFGIAIPLLLVAVAIGWVIRRKTDPRYNGIARARKETKIRKSNFKKSIKNKRQKNN